jgi:hypothetical protein
VIPSLAQPHVLVFAPPNGSWTACPTSRTSRCLAAAVRRGAAMERFVVMSELRPRVPVRVDRVVTNLQGKTTSPIWGYLLPATAIAALLLRNSSAPQWYASSYILIFLFTLDKQMYFLLLFR